MALDKTMLTIESLPEYRNLPPEAKKYVRDMYFDEMVAPKFGNDTAGAAEAKERFSQEHDMGSADPDVIRMYKSPKFQALPVEEKQAAIDKVFDKKIAARAPYMKPEDVEYQRDLFRAQNTVMEDDKPGVMSALWDITKNVPRATVTGVGQGLRQMSVGGVATPDDDEVDLDALSTGDGAEEFIDERDAEARARAGNVDYLTDEGGQGWVNESAKAKARNDAIFEAKYGHLKSDWFDPSGVNASLGSTVGGLATSTAMLLASRGKAAGTVLATNSILGASSKDEFIRSAVVKANEQSLAKNKRPLSREEQTDIIHRLNAPGNEYGMWETATEILGDASAGTIMRAVPGGKTFLKKMGRAAFGLGVDFAAENAGETLAGYEQNRIEAEQGMAEPYAPGIAGVKQAFDEQKGVTLPMMLMSKAPAIAASAYRVAAGKPVFEEDMAAPSAQPEAAQPNTESVQPAPAPETPAELITEEPVQEQNVQPEEAPTAPNAPEAGVTTENSPENAYRHRDLIVPDETAGEEAVDDNPFGDSTTGGNPNSPFNAQAKAPATAPGEIDLLGKPQAGLGLVGGSRNGTINGSAYRFDTPQDTTQLQTQAQPQSTGINVIDSWKGNEQAASEVISYGTSPEGAEVLVGEALVIADAVKQSGDLSYEEGLRQTVDLLRANGLNGLASRIEQTYAQAMQAPVEQQVQPEQAPTENMTEPDMLPEEGMSPVPQQEEMLPEQGMVSVQEEPAQQIPPAQDTQEVQAQEQQVEEPAPVKTEPAEKGLGLTGKPKDHLNEFHELYTRHTDRVSRASSQEEMESIREDYLNDAKQYDQWIEYSEHDLDDAIEKRTGELRESKRHADEQAYQDKMFENGKWADVDVTQHSIDIKDVDEQIEKLRAENPDIEYRRSEFKYAGPLGITEAYGIQRRKKSSIEAEEKAKREEYEAKKAAYVRPTVNEKGFVVFAHRNFQNGVDKKTWARKTDTGYKINMVTGKPTPAYYEEMRLFVEDVTGDPYTDWLPKTKEGRFTAWRGEIPEGGSKALDEAEARPEETTTEPAGKSDTVKNDESAAVEQKKDETVENASDTNELMHTPLGDIPVKDIESNSKSAGRSLVLKAMVGAGPSAYRSECIGEGTKAAIRKALGKEKIPYGLLYNVKDLRDSGLNDDADNYEYLLFYPMFRVNNADAHLKKLMSEISGDVDIEPHGKDHKAYVEIEHYIEITMGDYPYNVPNSSKLQHQSDILSYLENSPFNTNNMAARPVMELADALRKKADKTPGTILPEKEMKRLDGLLDAASREEYQILMDGAETTGGSFEQNLDAKIPEQKPKEKSAPREKLTEEEQYERAEQRALTDADKEFWQALHHRIDPESMKDDWYDTMYDIRRNGGTPLFSRTGEGISIDELADELETRGLMPQGGGSDALVERLKNSEYPDLKTWQRWGREDAARNPSAKKIDYGTAEKPNTTALGEYFREQLASGRTYKNIGEARQEAATLVGVKVKDMMKSLKDVDESIELGVVMSARDIVAQGKAPLTTFRELVDLYNRQPNLNVRTSTSVIEQAYSTPVPLGYMVDVMAGVDRKTEAVFEPTAGNGALLLAAGKKNVTANELNPGRNERLQYQGFASVYDKDATELWGGSWNAIVGNPPFGTLKDDNGKNKVFDVYGLKTKEIDQAIMLQALHDLRDDGKAVFIIGGKRGTDAQRSAAYNSANQRAFWNELFSNYNVVDHFTVSGDLYSRQGAGFPIDFIVIDGHTPTVNPVFPAANLPRVFTSFEELEEKLNEYLQSKRQRKLDSVPERREKAEEQTGNAMADSQVSGESSGGLRTGRPEESGEAMDSVRGRESGIHGSSNSERGSDGRIPAGSVSGPDTGTSGNVAGRDESSNERDGVPSDTGGHERRHGSGRSDEGSVLPGSSNESDTARERLDVKSQEPSLPKTKEAKKAQPKPKSTSTQAAYTPTSSGFNLGTLIPANMATPVQKALDDIAYEAGSLDAYITDALGYDSVDAMHDAFAAEQIDALALAINNIKDGKGFILGDQTGIGKGRVCAGILRWAKKNGKVPVFVTMLPDLYADMMRDLNDIGVSDFHPFITNANISGKDALVAPDGSALAAPKKKEYDSVVKFIKEHGELPKGYDAVFTSYSQLQSVSGKPSKRQEMLNYLAKNCVLVLDEAHNAGGSTSSIGEYMREFTRNMENGVLYSSATYAKRPDVMSLYNTTDLTMIGTQAQLEDTAKKGGLAMQQVISSMLAESGQYIRREKSFEGADMTTSVSKIDGSIADGMASSLEAIMQFSLVKDEVVSKLNKEYIKNGKTAAGLRSTGPIGASSVTFGSQMHNLVSQTTLAIKADAVIEAAKRAVESGEKPIITLTNTMGSFIDERAEDMELKVGEKFNAPFSALYDMYLVKSRTITIRYASGATEKHVLTDEELGPNGVALFKMAAKTIRSSGLDKLPVSPIDYIIDGLAKVGVKASEITGRILGIDYTGKSPVLKKREVSVAEKQRASSGFNSGSLDCLVINRSGSTGISLHSSEKFADKKRRCMLILQPDLDINVFMQTLGRVFRTGQVVPPRYEFVMSDMPSEQRPAAVLGKKMASLNANTTASSKGTQSFDNIPDFLNEYGDQAAMEMLLDDPELNMRLGGLVSKDSDSDGIVAKMTGRVPLLTMEEQADVYDRLQRGYNSVLETAEATGTNALDTSSKPLDAKLISSMTFTTGASGSSSPFATSSELTTMDVKVLGKPFTSKEVQQHISDGKKAAPDIEILVGAVEKYVKERTAKTKNEQQADKERKKISEQYALVSGMIRRFPVGSRVRMSGQNGVFLGYVVNYSHDEGKKGGNPVTPSSWKIVVDVADAKRRIVLPLNKLAFGDGSIDNGGMLINYPYDGMSDADFLDRYDNSQSESREKRAIVVGNIPAAFSQLGGRGEIITFDMHDGSRRMGIMLPKGTDIEEIAANMPVKFQKPEQAMKFVNELPSGMALINSVDGVISISIDAGSYQKFITMSVPAAKAEGGKYFTDRRLIGAIGGDFMKRGKYMRADIPLESLQGVLDYLYGKGVAFHTQSNKELAAKVTGTNTGKMMASLNGTGAGIKASAVRDAVTGADRVAGTKTQVVQSFAELPEEVRARFDGKNNALEGVNFGGKVYLVADNIRSSERAAEVWMHEYVGHNGFESLMSAKEKMQLTNRLFAMLGGVDSQSDAMKVIRRLAIKYKKNLSTPEGRDYVMREYLARLAEKESLTEPEQKVWRRLWTHIASTLRKAWHRISGNNVALAEDTIRDLLKAMKRQVTLSEQERITHLKSSVRNVLGNDASEGEFASVIQAFERQDEAYLDAIERGDMDTVRKMVDEKATKSLKDGHILTFINDDEAVSFKMHRGRVPHGEFANGGKHITLEQVEAHNKKWREAVEWNETHPDDKRTVPTFFAYKTLAFDAGGGAHATYAGTADSMPFETWLDAQAMQPFQSPVNGGLYIYGTTGANPKEIGLPNPPAPYSRYLSYRPAFHAGSVPAPMQMRVNAKQGTLEYNKGRKKADRLPVPTEWEPRGQQRHMLHNKMIVLVELPGEVNYQQEAEAYASKISERARTWYDRHPEAKRPSTFDRRAQLDHVPDMGYYEYMNQGEPWVLAGQFKLHRALTEDEIWSINGKSGIRNEGKTAIEWIGGYHPEEFGFDANGDITSETRYKLADPITYDDNGNVIPLSQRFDPSVDDVRFSIADDMIDPTAASMTAEEKARTEYRNKFWANPMEAYKTWRETRKERIARTGKSDKDDVGYLASMRSAFWLGKKIPQVEEMRQIELDREEFRSQMTQDFTRDFVEAYRELNETSIEYLRNITVQLDRATMKDPVTGKKGKLPIQMKAEKFMEDFLLDDGGNFVMQEGSPVLVPTELNDEYYVELQGRLLNQADWDSIDDKDAFRQAVSAYVAQRRAYDQMELAFMQHLNGMKAPTNIIDSIRRELHDRPFYYPHQRFGNWYVAAKVKEVVTNKDGTQEEVWKTVERIHYDALTSVGGDLQAAKYIKALREVYPGCKIEHDKIDRVPEEAFEAATAADVTQILNAAAEKVKKAGGKIDDDVLEELAEMSAQVFMERGIGQRQMHRGSNYVAGFQTENLMKTMVMYASGLSGAITKYEAARKFNETMGKFLQSHPEHTAGNNRTYNWMRNYAVDMLRNTDFIDMAVSRIKSALYLKYLGANIKSGIVNLTQNPTIGLPLLAADLGTKTATVEYFKGARKAILAMLGGIGKGEVIDKLSEEENDFLDKFWKSAAMRDTYNREVRGIVRGRTSQFAEKALAIIGAPMEYTERFNRLSFGLSVFRAARDGKITNRQTCSQFGMTPGEKWDEESALKLAKMRTREVHGGYGLGERAQFYRHGHAGRVMNAGFTFRTIMFNNIELWKAMLTDMGKAGRKSFALSMASLFAFGGTAALPFLGSFSTIAASALSSLFGGDDDPERFMKKHLGDSTGSTAYDWILYGTPALAGVTIKGSLSTDLPFTDINTRYGWLGGMTIELAKTLFGAAYSIGEQGERAYKAFSHGAFQQGMEYILPSAAANLSKAERLYTKGNYTVKGKPIPNEGGTGAGKLTEGEAIGQAIGFSPVSRTKAWDKKNLAQSLQEEKSDMTDTLVTRFMAAEDAKDLKAKSSVVQEWREWNQKHRTNPKMQIKPLPGLAKNRRKPVK